MHNMRVTKKRCAKLLGVSIVTALAASINPWPATSGVEIGLVGAGGLPGGYQPSGAVWHPRLQQLVLVGDRGRVSLMDEDGSNSQTWFPGGDLEGVAIRDPNSDLVYLAREDPDAILEFNLATGSLTGRVWDLTPWMTGPPTAGLEALTYVNGKFYAGHQGEGTIYIFSLHLPSSVVFLGKIPAPPEITTLSSLHYDADTRILYSIYTTPPVVIERRAGGKLLRAYQLPGVRPEGFAVINDCTSRTATVFVADDIGEVWRYENYPILCRTALKQNKLAPLFTGAHPGLEFLRAIGAE